MWSEVVKWTGLLILTNENNCSGITMISLSDSVKGDSATMLSQLQLNVFLPICLPVVFVDFFKVSVWSASQLWKTIAGVMLNANTSSMAAATIFFIIRFLNNVYYLLLCCKYIHFAGMYLMAHYITIGVIQKQPVNVILYKIRISILSTKPWWINTVIPKQKLLSCKI